jgi:hypothetical protein
VLTLIYVIWGYFSYNWQMEEYLKTIDEGTVIDGVVHASDDDEIVGEDADYDVENEERPLLKPRRRPQEGSNRQSRKSNNGISGTSNPGSNGNSSALTPSSPSAGTIL